MQRDLLLLFFIGALFPPRSWVKEAFLPKKRSLLTTNRDRQPVRKPLREAKFACARQI